MRLLLQLNLLFLFAGAMPLLQAQTPADSVLRSVQLLSDLVKANNYEDAQVEADYLLEFVQRNQAYYPSNAIPLISSIYAHHEDEKSALVFLEEVSNAARRNPSLAAQIEAYSIITDAYLTWKRPNLAICSQHLLMVAKDALAQQEQEANAQMMQAQVDSIDQLLQEHHAKTTNTVYFSRNSLLAAALGLALIIATLLFINWRTGRRLQKRLMKKELENELLRSERFRSTLPVEQSISPVPKMDQTDEKKTQQQPIYRPDKTALLIEPNRQIVLYLKSLLSDRFEVETAHSASEGLQIASNHLPDLIICDAVLNGQTGIDVVRQIKLTERTDHIPVILLTSRTGKDGELDALRAGADAWFNRPVLHHAFDNKISLLLDMRRQNHEKFECALNLYYTGNRIELPEPFLSQTVQLIDKHLNDPDFLSDDLARKMNLHKQLFVKKLFVLTGKEPAQLIREMRLEKAKFLLEKRAGTPQAIADLVGFSSAGSFALAFKEYFGENTLLLQIPDKPR